MNKAWTEGAVASLKTWNLSTFKLETQHYQCCISCPKSNCNLCQPTNHISREQGVLWLSFHQVHAAGGGLQRGKWGVRLHVGKLSKWKGNTWANPSSRQSLLFLLSSPESYVTDLTHTHTHTHKAIHFPPALSLAPIQLCVSLNVPMCTRLNSVRCVHVYEAAMLT